MGAHHQAALSFLSLPTGDRQAVCAMASQCFCARLLYGDSVGVNSTGERKRAMGGGSTRIRSEATPATQGDDDEPKFHLFRQSSPGGIWSASSFHKLHLNHQHPLVNRSIAEAATTKTEGWGMDETTTDEDAEDGSELESKHPMNISDIPPRSLVCEFLHLAFRICDEVDSEFKLRKSKKPHRLSTTSWDLLD